MPQVIDTTITFRPPVQEDLQAVHDLLTIYSRAWARTSDYTPDYTLEDLRSEWNHSGLNLASDILLALSADGHIVGYIGVARRGEIVAILHLSCVHPDYGRRGIGTRLLSFAVQRAQELVPAGRLAMVTWIDHENTDAQRLLQHTGFVSRERSIIGMEIRFDAPPPTPSWPEGFTVRTFVPGQDDTVIFNAVEEVFEAPFHHWEDIYVNKQDFDPTLWHLLWDGDELAGFVICDPVPDTGYVDLLGVRAPWRSRGLGKALLLHAFTDAYRRGLPKMMLSVNIQNTSPARTLYEQVGMYVTEQSDSYIYEVRPS